MMSARLPDRLLADFPRLDADSCRITSSATSRYNRIAWAARDKGNWWWPSAFSYWPRRVPRRIRLDAFIAVFVTLGYERRESGSLEEQIEKIVLFGTRGMDGTVEPTHAARQLASGWWTSKLGADEDIEHRRPEDLNGPAYGEVVQFMRRPRQVAEPAPPPA